ncbi:MAG: sugar ABC transporter ATP-binding protein [Clostridiales bacterium]|nr:sugar ABC transporter ATP-binding protein [Clostridiales bacterium]
MSEILLRFENISKAFPGVQALSEVSIDVKKGTIHALLGENGAGKSTLTKIISGIYRADSGEMTLEGQLVEPGNPREAQALGISVVHQELNLVDTLTVAENIFLGKLHKRGAFTDWNTVFAEAGKLIDDLGVSLAPQDVIKDLTIAQQQVVEICKAMTYNAKLFILDEPTATLTVNEIEKLFDIMRRIQRGGGTIIYISHRLEEVFEVCDELTVLRDGKSIGTKVVAETNKAELIRMMVGRELHEEYPYVETPIGETVLEIKGLVREGKTEKADFYLRKGEILGFSGLVGSGRTELMRAILGIDRYSEGEVLLHGKKVRYRLFSEAIKDRFGFITEDRKRQGLVLGMSVERNITLASLKSVSRFGFITFRKEAEVAKEYIGKLRVMTPSEKVDVKQLSGGNQQKVVLAKWLFVNSDIIIVDEPTRGIDVGAKVEIYKLLNDLTAEGKSVIMISSDMPELIGMCDRIYVMHEGRIKGELDRGVFSSERILQTAFS